MVKLIDDELKIMDSLPRREAYSSMFFLGYVTGAVMAIALAVIMLTVGAPWLKYLF